MLMVESRRHRQDNFMPESALLIIISSTIAVYNVKYFIILPETWLKRTFWVRGNVRFGQLTDTVHKVRGDCFTVFLRAIL